MNNPVHLCYLGILVKLRHQKTIVFVGIRNGQPAICWTGVCVGYGIFTIALTAAGLLGWYLLTLATGADFSRDLAFVIAFSIISVGTAVTSSITSSMKRPLNELPPID
jgi:hypothetical protein